MARRAARFTEIDLRRAIRAVKNEGADMAVEILPDGTIRIVPYVTNKPVEPAEERDIIL